MVPPLSKDAIEKISGECIKIILRLYSSPFHGIQSHVGNGKSGPNKENARGPPPVFREGEGGRGWGAPGRSLYLNRKSKPTTLREYSNRARYVETRKCVRKQKIFRSTRQMLEGAIGPFNKLEAQLMVRGEIYMSKCPANRNVLRRWVQILGKWILWGCY